MSNYPERTTTTEHFLDEKSVESQYGLSSPWLRKRRRLHLPPKYYRVGARMIRYKRTEIEEFLRNSAVEPAALHTKVRGNGERS